MRLLVALILTVLLATPARAAFTFPITFQAHAPLLASQLNTNFTSAATALTSGGNGFLPIGNTGGTYTSALMTSTGGTIAFTTGSGTLNLEIANSLIQHATVTISSADILAMYATPKQLIAAPAAGKNIVVHKAMLTMITSATGYAAGGAVHVQLSNTAHGAGTDTTATFTSAIVTAGAGTSYTVNIPVSYTGTAATGLFLSNDTAAFTTGTGTGVLDIWYSTQ